MSYKNSIKLLIYNFNIVWKQLLYLLCMSLIVFGLFTLLALPVFNMLSENGWVSELENLISTTYSSPVGFSDQFTRCMTMFVSLIKNNFSTLWLYYILIVFVVVFIQLLLTYISYYIIGELIDGRMSSLANFGYMSTLISKFKKAFRFACVSILLLIPFGLVSIAIFACYLIIAKNILSAVAFLPLVVMLILFVFALYISLTCTFMPEYINSNKGVWKSLNNSFKQIKMRYKKVLSTSICLVLTIFFINFMLMIFTLGAGLAISIPASFMLLVNFNMITYYTVEKRRYYLSDNLIVTTN